MPGACFNFLVSCFWSLLACVQLGARHSTAVHMKRADFFVCGSQDIGGTVCPQTVNIDTAICVDSGPLTKDDWELIMRNSKFGAQKSLSPVKKECQEHMTVLCAAAGGKPKTSFASTCETYCVYQASVFNAGEHFVTPFTNALLVHACLPTSHHIKFICMDQTLKTPMHLQDIRKRSTQQPNVRRTLTV